MSCTFTLRGRSDILSANYYPPYELDETSEYALGLIGLFTYNSIPNIEPGCNKIYYGDKGDFIEIPTGAYEIKNINDYVRQQILKKSNKKDTDEDPIISIKPNHNTLKCEIISKMSIDFTKPDTIGPMLGFSSKKIKSGIMQESDQPIQIIKVSTIRVNCNIISGSFYDSDRSHTLFEFSSQVAPGYAINIEPKNIVYLPVTSHRSINNITLSITDQNGRPVNFRGEEIVVRIELKRIS